MPEESKAPATADKPVAQHAPSHAGGDYSSSPVAAAKESFTTLWKNGKGMFAGFVAIQIGLAIVIVVLVGLALLAAFSAFMAFITTSSDPSLSQTNAALAYFVPTELVTFANQFNMQGTGGIVALLALIAAVLIGNFLNATYLSYTGAAVANNKVAHFGEVMRQAFKRSWALLSQAALVGLAFLLALLVPTMLLSPFAGPSPDTASATAIYSLLGIYVLALGIVTLILAPRFAFAPLLLVNEGMGPVQSLKQSWHLSRGRVWEIIGVISVWMLVMAVITLLIAFAEKGAATNTSMLMVLYVVEFIGSTVLGLFMIASVALRYRQAKHAPSSHKVNYGANIGLFALAIAGMIIVGSIQNTLNPAPTQFDGFDLQQDSSIDTIFEDDGTFPTQEELEQELQKYYEESQNLYDSSMDAELETTSPEDAYRLN